MSALPSQSFISRNYTMIVVASCCRAITLEWSGRGSNPQPQHCEGWGVWEFQSPRRWVGLEFDQQKLQNPEISFQSPRRWGGGLGRSDNTSTALPGGIVSIPSEVGRGRGSHQLLSILRGSYPLVSIPSEVGRGRAPSTCRRPWSKSRPAGFNPLGGGAGSGWSIWQALLNAFLL